MATDTQDGRSERSNRTEEEADRGYTRADFRAMRESLGVSQYDIAAEMGIDQRSVNRWERGREGRDRMPPRAAWSYLEGLEKIFEPMVLYIMGKGEEQAPSEDAEVVLRYYHDQIEYDSRALGPMEYWGPGHEGLPFMTANAATREAARRLRAQGRYVALRFFGEDDVEYLFDEGVE